MKRRLFPLMALALTVAWTTPSLASSISRQIIDSTEHNYPEEGEAILIKNIDLLENRVTSGRHVHTNYEHVLYVWVRGDLGEQTERIEVLLEDRSFSPISLEVSGPARRYGPDPAVGDEYFIYKLRLPVQRYNYDTYSARVRLDGEEVISRNFTVHNAPHCERPLSE